MQEVSCDMPLKPPTKWTLPLSPHGSAENLSDITPTKEQAGDPSLRSTGSSDINVNSVIASLGQLALSRDKSRAAATNGSAGISGAQGLATGWQGLNSEAEFLQNFNLSAYSGLPPLNGGAGGGDIGALSAAALASQLAVTRAQQLQQQQQLIQQQQLLQQRRAITGQQTPNPFPPQLQQYLINSAVAAAAASACPSTKGWAGSQPFTPGQNSWNPAATRGGSALPKTTMHHGRSMSVQNISSTNQYGGSQARRGPVGPVNPAALLAKLSQARAGGGGLEIDELGLNQTDGTDLSKLTAGFDTQWLNLIGNVSQDSAALGLGDMSGLILDQSLLSSPSKGLGSTPSLERVECYSRKVFVGGLPPDIDEEEIMTAFRKLGPLVVDWPHKAESKSYFPPKGYCFLLFQEELSVKALVESCIVDDGKLYWCVSSPTMKDKLVQIRPWNLADCDFVVNGAAPLDPRKSVFVGGVPRPLRAVELAMIMGRLYGGVCYAGIDTDPELKYPKGAGRVAFSNQQSYIAAISARFVQLQHGDIDKRVEIKPYVLDDQICDECQGLHSGGKYAPYFCANVTCLQYYCDHCWTVIHSTPGREFHKPLVKEGSDRPRAMPFRWC